MYLDSLDLEMTLRKKLGTYLDLIKGTLSIPKTTDSGEFGDLYNCVEAVRRDQANGFA